MHVLGEIGLVFTRSIRPTLRKPILIVVGLAQPMLFLLLFGPLLGRIGGDDDSWQWFVPGLVIQLALLGTAYAGYVLMPDIRSGVLDRLRTTPISRVALLLGMVLRDVALLLVQCAILLAASTAFGFRAAPAAIAVVLLFGLLTGVAIATTSHTLALRLRHEYVFGPVLGATIMPLMLLSGTLLPMHRGPDWLYVISRFNPLSYAVDAVRAVVAGPGGTSTVLTGGLVTLTLLAGCLCWGVRTFQRAGW